MCPNWCTSDLVITGPKDSVKRLVEFVKGDEKEDAETRPFDFNKIIPYPESLSRMDAYSNKMAKLHAKDKNSPWPSFSGNKCMPIHDGYNKGGYDWCCKNWGTKWNSRVEDFKMKIKGDKAEAYYNMDTAWSPPLPVLDALSRKFPDIEMLVHFVDEGGGFEEEIHIQNGFAKQIKNDDWKFRSGRWGE